jgi:tetratricopeptide (TPR) repeat protein
MDFPQFEQFAALGDWAAARKDIENVAAAPAATSSTQSYLGPRTTVLPRVALSLAKTGDMKGAWRVIAKLPMDCYFCLRVRGQIAQMQKNWNGAAYWFGRAGALAPSIPFAYTDWGRMLMAKGDRDGAIAKFERAHRKGPHFADPLEFWGEVLIAKNRSDLALAKFEEASKCAPNWGRLHLKWGEALLWSGNRDAAKTQFAIAAGLDTTPAERSELAKVRAHG